MAKQKAPLEGAKEKAPGAPTPEAKPNRKRLTWAQERFIEAYVDNGGNALAAYKIAYPKSTPGTARVESHRILENPRIKAAIDQQREADRALLNFKREDGLKILVAMATASFDEFDEVFKHPEDKKSYRGLGRKRYALKKRKTITDGPDGREVITEIDTISPGERRAAVNDLFDKLGFTDRKTNPNWKDGMAEFLDSLGIPKK